MFTSSQIDKYTFPTPCQDKTTVDISDKQEMSLQAELPLQATIGTKIGLQEFQEVSAARALSVCPEMVVYGLS